MILTIKGIISHKTGILDLVTEILHSNEFKQKQSGSQSEEKLMINNSESGRFFLLLVDGRNAFWKISALYHM